jgi:hypothetical protein
VQERLNTQVSLETAKLGAVDDNPEYKVRASSPPPVVAPRGGEKDVLKAQG